MDKIHVLHVVGMMDRGGTEALLMSLLRTIDRDKYQFDFVEQTEEICDYDEEILSLGSKIYRAPHISVKNLSEYRKWWSDFFKEHPEYMIIHGHSRGSGPVYLDEANKAGRITIAHCHSNSYGLGLRGTLRKIWQRPLRDIADYNFACSYDSGVSQYGRGNEFEVINNGIQTEKFLWNPEIRLKKRYELGLTNELVIGHVGRFMEAKNHDFLIDVFSEILKRRSDAVLIMAGEGELEDSIKNKVTRLGFEGKVRFLGIRDDVNELMQAMDAFVFPSKYEGLGIVNVEAQAAGLPCFTSDKVVPQEVKLTDLLHFIPLEAGEKVWADAILENMISTEDRRNTYQEIVDAGFDIKATAEWLCDFYAGVIEDGR